MRCSPTTSSSTARPLSPPCRALRRSRVVWRQFPRSPRRWIAGPPRACRDGSLKRACFFQRISCTFPSGCGRRPHHRAVPLKALWMTIRASAFSLTHRPIRPSARSSPRLRSASVFRRHGYAPSCARKSFGAVHAISPKGAMGLMQIMPATWVGLRQRYRLGADPYDAHDNIIAGAPFRASCTTAMAFPASSRPTTQVQRAGKITSRPAGRCRWRRRRTLHASLRSSAAMRPTMRFRSPPSSVPGPRRPCLSRVRSGR